MGINRPSLYAAFGNKEQRFRRALERYSSGPEAYAGEAEVRERFERARAEGDLPADADPAALAEYILTVIYGMTVKAASGATREDHERVIDTAMRAWPD